MLRRAAVLAVAALCGLLIAWALWPRIEAGPMLAPSNSTAESGASAVDRAASEGLGDLRAPGGDAARAPAERSTQTVDSGAGKGGPTATLPHDPSTVWIEVRDQREQRLAGVPVGLRIADETGGRMWWRGVTEAEGRVLAPNPTRTPSARQERAFAVLALPLLDSAAIAIERDHPPTAPLVLHLPATGAVDIEVLDPQPPSEPFSIRLRALRWPPESEQALDTEALVERGHARFPWVGLGLRLEAEARRPGQNQPTRLVFYGPTAPAQQQRIQLSLAPGGATIVKARIEDERGRACVQQRIDYTIDSSSAGSSSHSDGTVATSADAILLLVLDDHLHPDVQRTLSLRCTEPDGIPRSAIATLPRPLPPGEHDLGTLRLQQAQLVCMGKISDPQGQPIAGAEVAAGIPGRTGEDETWTPVRNLRAVSAANGVFAIHGATEAAQLQLRVRADGFLPTDSLAFAPGTAGLALTLVRGATVTGSVLAKPPLTATDVQLELHTDQVQRSARLDLGQDRWTFRFDALPAGDASLRIRTLGDTRGELRIDGIALRAGETTVDPRLQDIDLSAGLRPCALTVADELGQPLRDAMVFVIDGNPQQQHFEGLLLPAGHGSLRTRSTDLAALAWAPGYRWVQAPLTERTTFALPPAIPLTLALDPTVRLAAGESLVAQMWPLDVLICTTGSYELYSDLHARRSGTGVVPWQTWVRATATGGTAEMALPRTGRWRLRWLLGDAHGETVLGPDRDLTIPETAALRLDAGLRPTEVERARRSNR